MNVIRHCALCATTFSVPAYEVRRGNGVYCSKACLSTMNAIQLHKVRSQVGPLNQNWKGGRASKPARYYVDRYRQRYQEKASANDAVSAAVRNGRLVKPRHCQACGVDPGKPLHGHHDDYSRPLSVRWLCRPCHREADAERLSSLVEGITQISIRRSA